MSENAVRLKQKCLARDRTRCGVGAYESDARRQDFSFCAPPSQSTIPATRAIPSRARLAGVSGPTVRIVLLREFRRPICAVVTAFPQTHTASEPPFARMAPLGVTRALRPYSEGSEYSKQGVQATMRSEGRI